MQGLEADVRSSVQVLNPSAVKHFDVQLLLWCARIVLLSVFLPLLSLLLQHARAMAFTCGLCRVSIKRREELARHESSPRHLARQCAADALGQDSWRPALASFGLNTSKKATASEAADLFKLLPVAMLAFPRIRNTFLDAMQSV